MISRPHRAAFRIVATFAAACGLAGCATWQHAAQLGDSGGRTLAASDPAGAERLRLERAYDSALDRVLAEHGRPAFLHAVDRDQLFLFYPTADRVVLVERDGLPPGRVRVLEPIPGHFFRLLPPGAVASLKARRAAAAPRRAQRRPAAARAKPARVAPDAAMRLADFDVAKLVARMRVPLSAADPGLTGWRSLRLPDGRAGAVTRRAGAEYRIEPTAIRVVVSAAVGGSPEGARDAAVRVNRAVFGTRAALVTNAVTPWLAQVARDRHGTARVARRVEGRTVRIHRDRGTGALVYAVYAD